MQITQEHTRSHTVVVIGDVSGGGKYHLGDEAMTGVAIEELRDRGLHVILVAGEPEISRRVYSVPAVPRFGFWRAHDRTAKLQRLEHVVNVLAGSSESDDPAIETVRAVQRADAVVIAGGGNLNSRSNENQMLDRVAATRIAKDAGVPVYVSSQTVGPDLRREDWLLVREIVQYATVFGVRETSTLDLVRHMSGGATPVVHTMDDAFLVRPTVAAAEARTRFDLPERFAVASFTWHEWSVGVPVEEYYRRCARVVDGMIREHDVDVLLVPHMGVLGDAEQSGAQNDVFAHRQIRSYVDSPRVRELPMLAAGDVLSITSAAEFSTSTRYHPLVFGAATGVPPIGLSMSYYSAVRMRGALSNVGLEHLAIPLESWVPLFEERVLGPGNAVLEQARTQLSAVADERRVFQHDWWDRIVASVVGAGEQSWDSLPPVSHAVSPGLLGREIKQSQIASEAVNLDRVNTNVTVKQLRAELAESAERIAELKEQYAVLLAAVETVTADLAAIRHRMRPPGAALRDRIRRRAES